MNILFICNEYPPAKIVGGIGVLVRNMSRRLTQAGHHVTVIGLYSQPSDTDIVTDGIRVIRIEGGKKLIKLGWYLNRRRLFKKIQEVHRITPFDIIETSDYESGYFLMPKTDIPRVVRINGGEVYFRTLLNEKVKWKNYFIERASILKADAIAAVSVFSWKETFRILELDNQPPTIIPNIVDADYFSPDPTVSQVAKRMLYTGTFIRKKGVLELFQTLNKVFEQNPDAHMICIGSDTRDAITGSASTRALAMTYLKEEYHSKVQFLERIPNTEVRDYLRSAEVCIYPTYMEAHPIVIIEAMSCAKAIVSSTAGPVPESIEHNVSGLLCHPSDHAEMARLINLAISDPELRQRLGVNARKTVTERFSEALVIPLNLAWYARVIAAFKARRA